MWNILNKLTKLTTNLFSLKKDKGTTIVEVLVAVIIIGIVSMYGLSFFSSSYKYEVDSKDYDLILQNLVRQVEIGKGAVYEEGHSSILGADRYRLALAHPRKYPYGMVNVGSTANPLHCKNFNFLSNNARVKLREGCTVIYDYTEEENVSGPDAFFGTIRIVCEAQWPEEVAASKRNKITLVTYVANRWE